MSGQEYMTREDLITELHNGRMEVATFIGQLTSVVFWISAAVWVIF